MQMMGTVWLWATQVGSLFRHQWLSRRGLKRVRQFLEAVIVGYEIGIRLGIYLNRDQQRIFFGSGTWTAIGAAAGAKLLNLDPDKYLSALGIAEINMPLSLIMNWISLRKPPEVKEGMGWGALTGVSSALLAEQGMHGVFSLTEQLGGDIITHKLGHNFEIARLYYKQYYACRWTHPDIVGILSFMSCHDIDIQKIKKIRAVRTKKRPVLTGWNRFVLRRTSILFPMLFLPPF